MSYQKIKNLLEPLIAIILLLLLLPFLFFISCLVFFKLGNPIFFVQERPGLNTKKINLIKFRTMSFAKYKSGELLPDSYRLKSFGKFLRATSIDELPTLINIILGDMSFVGPRPLLIEYLPLYTDNQNRRHEVKPGITGWAQINGRNDISWNKKLNYDVWYVDNNSFSLDIKILLITVWKVFIRKGINSKGYVTTNLFKGG